MTFEKTALLVAAMTAAAATPGFAQSLGKFVVTKMAEMPVAELPAGELFWHVETFGSLDEAKAAGGAFSLAGEFDGKAWLFTLGDRKADGSGGAPVASIGPVPRIDAPEFLLRINNATAPVGAKTSIHSHPGPEAFLILSGQLTQRTPYGAHVLNAGGTMPGVPDQAMEVVSTGDEELRELIMFIVDPSKPFAEDAHLN
jgi:quercetin dioxygenase-like cupin family protein